MRLLLLVLLLAGMVAAETLEKELEARNFEQALVRIARELPQAVGSERLRLLLLRADCEVQLQRLDAAEQTLARIPVQGAPPRFFRVRGQLNLARNEKDLARKDFRHVLELKAEPFARIVAACELARLEEDPAKATEWWNLAVEASQQPGMTDAAWGTLYRHRLGLLMESGRQGEALSEARLARAHFHALGKLDGERGMWLAEALILKNMGRFQEAEVAWTRAVEQGEKNSGGTLTVWGYNVLYGRTDPAALRRFLAACEKHWSERWSQYERFHLRMLAGQIHLMALNEPRQAMKYLGMAEKLAWAKPRLAGNFVTVSIRFHRLSSQPPTELEQVLWLELHAVRKLGGDVVAFMESKLPRMPATARAPWLFTLGKELLGKAPDRAAARFAEALEGSTGADRARLLEAMLEAYLDVGRMVDARQAAQAFGESLGHVSMPEALEITRNLLTLWQPWTQPLWLGSLEPTGESPQVALVDGMMAHGGLRDQFEQLTRKELEAHLRTQDPVALCKAYGDQARQLALENKLAEALVACERSREYAVSAQLLEKQAAADRLLAYLQFRLGDRTLALERIRQARTDFARLTTFDRADEVADCAALEAAFLLEMHRPQEALELLQSQPARPVLDYAQARALLMLQRPAEALQALDRCELRVEGTLYAVAVKTLRAVALRSQGKDGLSELSRAYALASSLKTLKVRELALLWHEWDPASAPVQDAATLVEGVLAALPATFSDKVGQRPLTRQLMTLAGRTPSAPEAVGGSWLTRADFLREAGALLQKYPELATTVPLLPASLVQKAEGLGDQVLVEYYLGARELVVFVAAREGFAVKTLTVERKAIEERVARVRRSLLGGSEDVAAASELARVLLDPRLAGRPLVILAHGPLLGLPWDLLPGPPLEWSLWAGEALTRYTSPAPQVLAVGNVTGVDLPGSAREVEAVGRLLPGQVLTGDAATTSALREGVAAADVVHLATHSTPAYLQLSDGKLAQREIYGLPLRPGALVVLSSCEGAAAEGQERGPVTLASAFLAAGASQVVASLTPVADEEAEALFGEFYRGLARGLAPGAALREAKAARRKAGGRADWAAFVLLAGS